MFALSSLTPVFVGAGPGIATGTAELFARHKYDVGFISRSQDTLDAAKAYIASTGVKTASSPASTADTAATIAALESLKRELGPPSIVLYNVSALRLAKQKTPLLELTPETLNVYLQEGVVGALAVGNWAAQNLVPDNEGRRSLFFTGGSLSKAPRPTFEALSIDKHALDSLTKGYAAALPDIHVALLTVCGLVSDQSETHTKEKVAAHFWTLHEEKKDSSGSWTREVVY